MKKIHKNNIIPQMFDVRPVNETGNLNLDKIREVEQSSTVKIKENYRENSFPVSIKDSGSENGQINAYSKSAQKTGNLYELIERVKSFEAVAKVKVTRDGAFKKEKISFEKNKKTLPGKAMGDLSILEEAFNAQWHKENRNQKNYNFNKNIETIKQADEKFSFGDLFLPHRLSFGFNFKASALIFAMALMLSLGAIGGVSFWKKGEKIRGDVLGTSNEAYSNLMSAIEDVKAQNFLESSSKFEEAYNNFSNASNDLEQIGGALINASKFFPATSQLASGKNVVESGKHISLAGKHFNEVGAIIYSLKEDKKNIKIEDKSFLDIFESLSENLEKANEELLKAQEYIDKVNVDDLPEDKQLQFVELKGKLGLILKSMEEFSENSHIIVDLLGGNGPRKYLFLFQNNQEIRATGGFIGSYGLLDVSQGRVKKFFIDGIFNPDGQLTDKIVPPKPIQKISAAWSLHDSNWFPEFPLSAEKAILFYEKTGGPTADGVITLTPTVLQKLLEITGPIRMDEYDTILTADNFIENIQYEVEKDYNEEENRPKKILSDLAPMVLDRLLSSNDLGTISKTAKVLGEALSEKHILLYSRNDDLQKILSNQNWSGEILQTSKDYLSVVNTNINGYKTDGIIDETIRHEAEIQKDGRVIDTVTITREHNGGNEDYEWWNKVNSNYMRVYVPEGSQLLEVEGQTREFNDPPLDYEKLKFKVDPDIAKEENEMTIDEDTGTRVYNEFGKTVFANWAYVSPQEKTVVKYKYLLPFEIGDSGVEVYSLLVQKQSGSLGSDFESRISYSDNWKIEWSTPEKESAENKLEFGGKLNIDNFFGVVFSEK